MVLPYTSEVAVPDLYRAMSTRRSPNSMGRVRLGAKPKVTEVRAGQLFGYSYLGGVKKSTAYQKLHVELEVVQNADGPHQLRSPVLNVDFYLEMARPRVRDVKG